MNALAAHEITVVGPTNGMYFLGYYASSDSKFFVIQPFGNAGLAQATANLMNRARELAKFDEAHHGR